MEDYDKFIKVKKIKSPKINRNPIITSYKKELKKSYDKDKSYQVSKHKKINILSKKKKRKSGIFIPTDLNFKNIDRQTSVKLLDKPDPVKPDPVKPDPVVKPIEKPKRKNQTKRIRKKVKDNKYKDKTISVKLKKNKEQDIKKIIKQFDDMDLSDIQSKLKSKGIHSKNTNKNKLLKYMYLSLL